MLYRDATEHVLQCDRCGSSATGKCLRCEVALCEAHQHTADNRCATCESDYDAVDVSEWGFGGFLVGLGLSIALFVFGILPSPRARGGGGNFIGDLIGFGMCGAGAIVGVFLGRAAARRRREAFLTNINRRSTSGATAGSKARAIPTDDIIERTFAMSEADAVIAELRDKGAVSLFLLSWFSGPRARRARKQRKAAECVDQAKSLLDAGHEATLRIDLSSHKHPSKHNGLGDDDRPVFLDKWLRFSGTMADRTVIHLELHRFHEGARASARVRGRAQLSLKPAASIDDFAPVVQRVTDEISSRTCVDNNEVRVHSNPDTGTIDLWLRTSAAAPFDAEDIFSIVRLAAGLLTEKTIDYAAMMQ